MTPDASWRSSSSKSDDDADGLTTHAHTRTHAIGADEYCTGTRTRAMHTWKAESGGGATGEATATMRSDCVLLEKHLKHSAQRAQY